MSEEITQAVGAPLERHVRPLVAERVVYGAAGAIPLVDEATTGDVFENAIRRVGVVAACEWFGHAPDSEFTRETIRVLQQRAGVRPNERVHPGHNSARTT